MISTMKNSKIFVKLQAEGLNYIRWLDTVDSNMLDSIGFSIYDLKYHNWRDAFEEGYLPEIAIINYLDENPDYNCNF